MTLGGTDTSGSALIASYEHRDFQESVSTFLARRVMPDYDAWRREGRIPDAVFGQAAEDGFLGTGVPEEHGGLGIEDRRFSAIVAVEAMRAGANDLGLTLALHNDVVVPALRAHASEQTAARWLPSLAGGEVIGTVLYGPEISPAGGDTVVVRGRCEFVVAGGRAGLLLVVGETGVALVDPAADGVRRVTSPRGIGLEAADFADIEFDDAPGTALDGQARDSVLADLFLATAMTAAAGSAAALELTLDYVRDRTVFSVPLGSLQNSRRALAEAAAHVQGALAFSDACLVGSLAGTLDRARAAACAEHAVSAYRTVVDIGVQLHGGYGYIMEYPIAHAYADAQFWELHAGGAAVRHEAVASTLLA